MFSLSAARLEGVVVEGVVVEGVVVEGVGVQAVVVVPAAGGRSGWPASPLLLGLLGVPAGTVTMVTGRLGQTDRWTFDR